MKPKAKLVLGGFALILCAVVGAWMILAPTAVETQPVLRGTLVNQVTERGTLVPEKSMTLLADISGTVRQIAAKAGHSILEGETLVEIDASVLQTEISRQIEALKLQQSALYAGNSSSQAELSLRREQLRQQLISARQEYDALFGKDGTAGALLSIARNNYVRARRLYGDAKDYYDDLDEDDDDYSPARLEMDRLRNELNTAKERMVLAESNSAETTESYYQEMIASYEAQISMLEQNDSFANNSTYAAARQLQLTIDELGEKLTRGTVVAPFDSMVWRLTVEEGDYVQENQPIATLYGQGGMKIEALLLSEDALALRIGDTASCRFANGSEQRARVGFVSPVAEEVVSTIGLTENRCRIELVPDEVLPNAGAGHELNLTFDFVAAKDVLSIPAGCIVPHGTGSAVYLVQDGQSVLMPVQTGIRSGGRVEILSGLSEGDQVVQKPLETKLRDKGRVKPLE